MVIDGTRHQTSAAVPRVLLECVVLNKETNIALKFSLACLISYGTINFNISFDIYVPCWKNIFFQKVLTAILICIHIEINILRYI